MLKKNRIRMSKITKTFISWFSKCNLFGAAGDVELYVK